MAFRDQNWNTTLASPATWVERLSLVQESSTRLLHRDWEGSLDELVHLSRYEAGMPGVSATLQAMLTQLIDVDIENARRHIQNLLAPVNEFISRPSTPGDAVVNQAVNSLFALSDLLDSCWPFIVKLLRPSETLHYWTETTDQPIVASGVYWVRSEPWLRWELAHDGAYCEKWANECHFNAELLERVATTHSSGTNDRMTAILWDDDYASGAAFAIRPPTTRQQHPPNGSRDYWLEYAKSAEISVWQNLDALRVGFEDRTFPYDELRRQRDLIENLFIQIPHRQFAVRAVGAHL